MHSCHSSPSWSQAPRIPMVPQRVVSCTLAAAPPKSSFPRPPGRWALENFKGVTSGVGRSANVSGRDDVVPLDNYDIMHTYLQRPDMAHMARFYMWHLISLPFFCWGWAGRNNHLWIFLRAMDEDVKKGVHNGCRLHWAVIQHVWITWHLWMTFHPQAPLRPAVFSSADLHSSVRGFCQFSLGWAKSGKVTWKRKTKEKDH